MLSSYKKHFRKIKSSGLYIQNEMDYFHGILTKLLDQLATDIEQLTDVVTERQLEMNDDERIKRIDALHKNVSIKYNHFFSFIDRISLLARQRRHEANDLQTLKQLYNP